MSFRLSSIYKSLTRHLMDTIEDVKSAGIATPAYYAWDSHGDDTEIDAVDLMGLAGWTFEENGGLWKIHVGITVSTINDQNLFREIDIIDAIHDRWGEGAIVPMLDPDTGDEYTQLVVNHFEMLPAGNSEKRNYRPIGLELLRTSNDG